MLFRLLNNRHDKFHKLWEFWEISPKQIDENQKQSQIIIGERLPSQRLSLITKIILIIFTTANDSPKLAHRSFDGFKWPERAETSFLEKHHAGARANIEQKPYEAFLIQYEISIAPYPIVCHFAHRFLLQSPSVWRSSFSLRTDSIGRKTLNTWFLMR